MDHSKLNGGTELSWYRIDASSWIFSAKLSLTLHIHYHQAVQAHVYI